MQYVFPALFTRERPDRYVVEFPNISGCYTSGKTLAEAMENARDALGLMLAEMEDMGYTIPIPDIFPITTNVENDQFKMLISTDTDPSQCGGKRVED